MLNKTNYFALLITVTVLISCSLFGENKKETKNNTPSKYEMTNYQNGNEYLGLWEKVNEFEKKGLPKSALKTVNGIYKLAINENNVNQIIKTTLYKLKYNQQLKEDDYVIGIAKLDSMINYSQTPQKQILQSILAQTYWGYYTQNRWKINGRTKTINFKKDDIRTWSLEDIVEQVNSLYLASLENANKTQEYSINSFKTILIEGKNTDTLRPTLYDFLANRALPYFQSTEPDITKPAYFFSLENENLFSEANTFVNLKIESKDTASMKLKALQIYQKLTSFHLNKSLNREALADLEMNRLSFVKQYHTSENKTNLYLKAITKLEDKYKDLPVYATIYYQKGMHFMKEGNKYRASIKSDENEIRKTYKRKAVLMFEEGSHKFPDSYGGKMCKNMIINLNKKKLSFTVEEAILPNQKTKGIISYTNVRNVYFKIIKLDYDTYENKRFKNNTEMFNYLNNKDVLESWNVALPFDENLNSHATEFIVPAMNNGYYVIMASTSPDFIQEKNTVLISNFWVTNISYISRSQDGKYEFTVLNRETGEPMKDVKAKVFYKKYNYTLRKNNLTKLTTLYTDKDGYFVLPKTKKYRNVLIDFSKDEDRFNPNNYFYQYRNYENKRPKARTSSYIFTDRAIYRPNQSIYFKALLTTKIGNEAKVIPNKKVTLTFYDVNGQELAKDHFTTNEYGTVSGSFIAPDGGLNGQMRITCTFDKNRSSSKYIRVEEYKRPKFEVKINPIKGEYKLGDKIKVQGLAKAFAGNPIDGAQVKYSVTRNASFPWWCWYYYGFQPNSAEMQLENGNLITDENGNFDIEFTAIADKLINEKYSPTYSYRINADVTDINGETHSTTQYVSVGYKSLVLNINLPNEINTNSSRKGFVNKFKINSTNLNGEKIESKGEIILYKLKKQPKLFVSKKWGNPDVFLISKKEHDRTFPNRAYGDKSTYELQEEGKKEIKRYNFDTKFEENFIFSNLSSLEVGEYKIEYSAKDKNGQEVKEMKVFTVFDDKENEIPLTKYFWTKAIKQKGEPGETAEFLIGTKAKKVEVLYEIEHNNEIISKKWISLDESQTKIEVPIQEKHRGNFGIHLVFVKDNHVYRKSFTITVPHTDKQLDITFETFRNKLLPGQNEKWKVNIKSKTGEKIMAEMLASMYDASLDEFAVNNFMLNIYTNYYSNKSYSYNNGFGTTNPTRYSSNWNEKISEYPTKSYNSLNWFGFSFWRRNYRYLRGARTSGNASVVYHKVEAFEVVEDSEEESNSIRLEKGGVYANYGDVNGGIINVKKDLSQVKARKNFNETALFYPNLTTNKKGDISIEFDMPEALTKWKFLGLAHTKDMKIGTIQREVVTQKDLMVVPNVPRFFREGDDIIVSAKISNISDKDLDGKAQLFLFDAFTNKPIDLQLKNISGQKTFKANSKQSTNVEWSLKIPSGVEAVTYKIVAQAGNFTDGEENAIPILTNRMLVTESMPLPMNKKGEKIFTFNKLINNKSTTLKHHKLTLEYTSNPAWYVVQAMPYMMEYPYECAEQTFTRFYANSLATHIMNANPKIKKIVKDWENNSPEEFLSNLEKNQELKSILLEETPWVMDAKNESKRKQRISQLFELNKMSKELSVALRKLQKMQVSNGAWAWFPGMKESRYITQHIVTGMGHLDDLGVKNVRKDAKTWLMTKKAINYLDSRLKEDFEYLKKHNKKYKEGNHLNNIQIQYLYARSFFTDVKIPSQSQEAFDYYLAQSKKYWLNYNNYTQGMIALANYRLDTKAEVSQLIVNSLREKSITHPELGMYWKGMINGGYYWYQAPIETQALMIELFDRVADDQKSVNELKTWLLKQKQTTNWKTTKATAEACYALLLDGSDILANDEKVEVKVGNIDIVYSGNNSKTKKVVKANAGTGYFKTSWNDNEIVPEMGKVSVTKQKDGVAWGAMYWQYFEDLDKISPHKTPLSLKKELFIERVSEKGKILEPVSSSNLKIGDKIIVRIVLKVDRVMEYVHMKDMRASGLEPIHVISRYKWKDGLGYYEVTKDASTNFFMDYLPRGTYVFEYPLRVSQKGDFSNGITSIQCMYAPEFTSHSKGVRVKVD